MNIVTEKEFVGWKFIGFVRPTMTKGIEVNAPAATDEFMWFVTFMVLVDTIEQVTGADNTKHDIDPTVMLEGTTIWRKDPLERAFVLFIVKV